RLECSTTRFAAAIAGCRGSNAPVVEPQAKCNLRSCPMMQRFAATDKLIRAGNEHREVSQHCWNRAILMIELNQLVCGKAIRFPSATKRIQRINDESVARQHEHRATQPLACPGADGLSLKSELRDLAQVVDTRLISSTPLQSFVKQ